VFADSAESDFDTMRLTPITKHGTTELEVAIKEEVLGNNAIQFDFI